MSGNLTNLGFSAQTKDLFVENIYYAPSGSINIQLPTNFVNSILQKIVFDILGNLNTLGSIKFFSGSDLSSVYTSTNRYTVGLNGSNDFEIFDTVSNTWIMRIDSATGITTFAGVLTAITQLITDGSLLINDSNPIPVANFEMSVISGILIFNPIAQVFPLTTGLIYFDYTGSITIQGNNCSLKISDRSTINVWSIFSNAGLLSFYNGTTVVGTINQTGITTLVPQKIQNTLQTTGTQFLCMMPQSATTSAGQVIGTHATLSYNVATAALSTTTMVATTFIGDLNGSCTLVDTTAVSTNATYYLPFVPLATTQSSGQVLGVDAGITYNPSTNALTTTGSVVSTFVISPQVLTSGLYFPYTGPTTNDQSFVWDATIGLSLVSDSTPAFDGHLTLQQINIRGLLGVIRLYEQNVGNSDYWDIEHLTNNKLQINYNGTQIVTLSKDGQLSLEGGSAGVVFDSQTSASADYWNQYSLGATNASVLYIDYFNGTTTINPLLLTKNGNVGLGTSASSAVGIELYGTGTSSLYNNDSAKGKIEFLMNNVVRLTAGGTTPGTASLSNAGNWTVTGDLVCPTLRMNGSTNRQGFAYVSGTTNLVAQNVASGTNFGSGNHAFLAVGGTTWTASSDRRLKYDIKPFESCLDKVLALNPVTYKWIETQTPSLGFIAQEMQQIIPELVVVPENPENMMGIDLTNLTSFLVKAIQEQHLMILDLQNKINMLLNGKSDTFVAP